MLGLGASVVSAAEMFDFEVLQFRAKALAARPYEAPPSRVPDWLLKYDYDQHRDIRFDPMWAWGREEKWAFQTQFFHPGWLFNRPVQIHRLKSKEAELIPFSTRYFNYGRNKPGRMPGDVGYAGFRLHYALNRPDYLDELAVFLGASYFRALGKDQHYGLSARGLALNTGEPGGEEFPVFQEFWIEDSKPDAEKITIYALLNSPSVAGAYKFVITPGDETVMRVHTALYARQNVAVFGVAPLTSMFAHGENTGWARNDFRPEVHDSDGLLMQTGAGEWIWRPLVNPTHVRINSFMDQAPKGFGLLQRDREFAHYDDLEAFYHQRPSVWVEPIGNWGAGAVRLVELPTRDETNDNIVAFWVPAQLPPAGEPIIFDYKLYWMMEPGRRPPAGYATSTRIADVLGRPDLKRFVIDFESPYLKGQPTDPEIEAMVSVGTGTKQDGRAVVQKNRFTGAWRVAFEIKTDGVTSPVELRCFLRKGPHVLTETWSYLWQP